MEVKFKKTHKDAVTPKYAKHGDAGMDLVAVSVEIDEKDDTISYDTGIAVEIPDGYVGLVFPRSSICKKDLILSNSVGVIDSGYRGSIKAKFKADFDFWDYCNNEESNDNLKLGELDFFASAEAEHFGTIREAKSYAVGERICQLIIIPYPKVEFKEVDELSETSRGSGGHGSTGK